MNSRDIVLTSNMKEMILLVNSMRRETWNLLVNHVHVFGDGHDEENFRGCTHPDCIALQQWYRENMEKL